MADATPVQAAAGAVVPVSAAPLNAVAVPTTFRERLGQFRILEERRLELIEELLDKLEKTEAKLAQTELDLQSEQNVRRTLQAEVVEAKERESSLAQKQARRPFALVLIDADAEGFTFQDKYLTKRTAGGESLADDLLIRTRELLRPLYPSDADTLDILIRIYSNLESLANTLVRDSKLRNLGQLRAASTGFCGRIAGFDWIDVGVAKDGISTRKVKENVALFAPNCHLRHLFLALDNKAMSPAFLTALPLRNGLASLTLIESAPLPPAISSLPDLRTAKLSSIFAPLPLPKSPRSRGRGVTSGGSGHQLQLTQQEDPDGGSTWLVIRPERSKSQGVGGFGSRGRRGGSDDEDSSLSISIGPDNTVSVDSGRRRRVVG
ncbi:uncharacterized protein EI97DRAFT_81859 [Westerdykella ornata]|uniref:DUF7923 domain-containing protein n=1 Tax=Westerdykella ornata TaxID=318751 RepID=A0A6A6JGZ5_WESOR|nr:uncharacterized protein EI97DRAFT_81859 [Westerdykella ornata]KAF2275238.1 hypothetical protein EI97DRAFT_81859 [Westerdykella ornata]